MKQDARDTFYDENKKSKRDFDISLYNDDDDDDSYDDDADCYD